MEYVWNQINLNPGGFHKVFFKYLGGFFKNMNDFIR